MIKFYDSSGTVHFGQATITRKTSVNGGLSLTGEVFAGDDVLNGLDYGWWLNFDNEKYVITYKKLSDDTNTVVFDAVQQFFWDFSKVALHAQYTGSHEYSFYLGQLFDKSGYTYKNDATVPAFEKENWGYKNKLDLFNDIIDQAGVEFEVHNETVHIAKQIGSDLTNFVRKGINLSDLTEEMKISDFATYAKGYGAFKDAQDQSKGRLEVEYRSELAKQFGDLEMDPIVDERYTIANNLIAALKKQVDATYTVSMTMNIYDLENAGYPNYKAPKVGDWILAIDEALNFKRKIRIIKLEEQFDVTGKRIGYTATCGDLNIVDQYTHLQISLDSKVQRIRKTVDAAATSANGKNTNYYGAKEPVSANEGDLWFDQSNDDPDKWSIKQWLNGRWEQITLNPGEVDAKVDVAKKEAETAVENAKSASDKADQLAAKYDDTNALANQAMDKAVGAQSDASYAVAKANSTASEFGKVDQKADSAVTSALNAQSSASSAIDKANSTASGFGKVSQKTDSAVAAALNAQSAASTAVTQASSAAADSKDAKQIAGAVSQSYKTLTDGSTMTIAELQNGLAAKLTKSDLNGYATETWAQNQINATADGINATLSSVKSTVDGQTTSINDLKADSSSFKTQFTTVNNTLGKQTTDIGSLQATSKELTTGFNTLTSDNTTNKNDISQLKQTATEVSSTLETVQTQVKNSAVGTNLIINSNFSSGLDHWAVNVGTSSDCKAVVTTDSDGDTCVHITGTGTSCGLWCGPVSFNQNQLATGSVLAKGIGTLSLVGLEGRPASNFGTISTESYSKVSTTTQASSRTNMFTIYFNAVNGVVDMYIKFVKLELGSNATDWCLNPSENATVTALSKLSQTVDGMKLDISKKIEQKDLNGYATQAWARNQINSTADGINATLSSVKTTVNGHATSINDLKADSSSFKSQFTTVNDTLGKHTTDIGTLQASSKELTTGFNTLTSDNTTNKNDISQLKQTATEVSSTLETVQTQVQNSAVGTNLLTGTSNTQDYTVSGSGWALGSQSSNGNSRSVPATPGKSYTYSAIIKSTTYDCYPEIQFFDSGKNFIINSANAPGKDTGMRKTTAVAPENVAFVGARMVLNAPSDSQTVVFNSEKLEKGNLATDWCPNPADNATVTAVSSISQTVDSIQTTVRGKVDNDVYQSKMTQLDSQITTVVGQVNSLGQKNLIANSQFQYDWQNSWSISSHDWANWYTSNFTWAWLDGYQGICANIPQSQSESWPHVQSSDVAVREPGVTAYSASVYVNIDWVETNCVLDLSFYNAAGVRTFHDTTASNKGLNFLKLENIVSPKDAVRVHMGLHVHDHGHVAFIKPMLVQDSSVGKYIPDNASWTEVQQTYNSINLKVSKDGVINAINVSPEGTTIYGNKLRITAATYIDNAVIKDAMIAGLNASKLTAGSIDAAKINVYNINGSKIVANSITADKLQAGSMLIAMNSTLQTLKVGTDGLYTTNNSGTFIGKIHANNLIEHPGDWGLHFDLSSNAQYMAWGAQNEGDPNGGYVVKFGWTRNSSAGDFTMPWGGFWFNDNVMLHKNLRFNGGGIDVDGAYQLMKFAWISMNGIKYPFFGSSNLKAGWLFGSYETYLVRDGGIINASKILGVLNGQHYKFIKDLNSNGTVKGYVDVKF
ncbi:phage tail protein [Lactiplantibacillus plantarum]|uniref:phage tail protein n=1 Tax=Lactiplantibacillus plantarum TaxID=1590 RepID=UPI003C143707